MSQPDVSTEMRRAASEPLLPIEKKLVGWSVSLGVTLLLLLLVVTRWL